MQLFSIALKMKKKEKKNSQHHASGETQTQGSRLEDSCLNDWVLATTIQENSFPIE